MKGQNFFCNYNYQRKDGYQKTNSKFWCLQASSKKAVKECFLWLRRAKNNLAVWKRFFSKAVSFSCALQSNSKSTWYTNGYVWTSLFVFHIISFDYWLFCISFWIFCCSSAFLKWHWQENTGRSTYILSETGRSDWWWRRWRRIYIVPESSGLSRTFKTLHFVSIWKEPKSPTLHISV